MKRVWMAILAFVLIFSNVGVAQTHAASKKSVYKAYYNLISQTQGEEYDIRDYKLIYLDNNKVPELVVRKYCDTLGSSECDFAIYTYYKGKAVDITLDRDTSRSHHTGAAYFSDFSHTFRNHTGAALLTVCYIPKSGKLLNHITTSQDGCDDIYKLSKGKLKIIADGEHPGIIDEWSSPVYKWNGKVVSESEYYKLSDKTFNSGKSKGLVCLKYKSRSKMLKYLKSKVK